MRTTVEQDPLGVCRFQCSGLGVNFFATEPSDKQTN